MKKGANGWTSGYRTGDSWWLDRTNKVIYIGNTDWAGTTYRTADDAADRLMAALKAIYVEYITPINQEKEIDLLLGADYARQPWYVVRIVSTPRG